MPRRSIHSVMATRTSRTETSMPWRADIAWRRNWVTETPRQRLGVLEGEEQPGLAPHLGRPARDVLALQADGAPGDPVAGVPEQDVGQRGLAGPVRAHEGVDLAREPPEGDAAEDLGAFGAHMEVVDLEEGGGGSHRSKSYYFGQLFRPGPLGGMSAQVRALTSRGRPTPGGSGTRPRSWWRRRGRGAPPSRRRTGRRGAPRSTG